MNLGEIGGFREVVGSGWTFLVLAACFGGLCVFSVCFAVGVFLVLIWFLGVKMGFLDLLLWFCLL